MEEPDLYFQQLFIWRYYEAKSTLFYVFIYNLIKNSASIPKSHKSSNLRLRTVGNAGNDIKMIKGLQRPEPCDGKIYRLILWFNVANTY